MDSKLALGIDIGGTNTKIGLVNKHGGLLKFTSFPSRSQDHFEDFLQDLKNQVNTLLNGQEVLGIGIGAPDAVPSEGVMGHPANFNWGINVPLIDAIKNLFGLKTFLTNDANAAALGEWYFGQAKGMKNFVVITLGTGVGSGFVVEGQLLEGHKGIAGEFGHMIAIPNGRTCTCGLKGCLETYVAARGIRQTAREMVRESKMGSQLNGLPEKEIRVRRVAAAAREGDILARQVFEETGKILGRKLADLVALFNPEAIILSGGISKDSALFLNTTKKSMEAHLFSAFKDSTKILISKMEHANAAVLGASALVFKKLQQ